ncbi:MAG: glycerate kinase [gamma proteobacterium symbiont of Bathyaustriella thionipta]|nr:glycerate kinase [gamma proteobacterium symbiont of Bathyaustriella thionipta]
MKNAVRILLAPDSFKGSLSASRICESGTKILQQQLPDASILATPMADGGEGTLDALLAGSEGEKIQLRVSGPMGNRLRAHYARMADGETAVIEMAQASGLPLVVKSKRNPSIACSHGTGELIADALDKGARRIIVGIGGSASNDGGCGALHALGVKFLDADGQEFHPNGKTLHKIQAIDNRQLHAGVAESEFVLACDVNNPLLGEQGATQVYAGQKGADSKMLESLEKGMQHYAEKVAQFCKQDNSQQAGTGAGGGLAFGLLNFCNARLHNGFDLIAQASGLLHHIEKNKPDLIISGEGELDEQSLNGKLVGRIAALAKSQKIPLLVLSGNIALSQEQMASAGISSARSIVSGPMPVSRAVKNAEPLLCDCLQDIGRWLAAWHG